MKNADITFCSIEHSIPKVENYMGATKVYFGNRMYFITLMETESISNA